jgi:hypothetical protein
VLLVHVPDGFVLNRKKDKPVDVFLEDWLNILVPVISFTGVRVEHVFYFSDIGRLDSGHAFVILVNGKVGDFLTAYCRKCLPLVRIRFVANIQRVKADVGIFRSQFYVVWRYLAARRAP